MRFDYFDLLSGDCLPVQGVGHLRPPKVKDLYPSTGIGYRLYNLYIALMSWDKGKILEYIQTLGVHGVDRLKEAEKLNAFDVLTILPLTRELCRDALSFFMLEDLEWNAASRKFVAALTVDDEQHISGEINRSNFDEVRDMILNLNYIRLSRPKEPTSYASNKAKELWEQAQKAIKEIDEQKQKEDKPEYHIGNIISKVCAAHPNYNFLNVGELTVFQLYDAFFQTGYLRSIDLSERIYSNHGGEHFRFEDWINPILKQS